GAEPDDREAGGAATRAADLGPGAVLPFIDEVTGRAAHTVPRQVDLRRGYRGGRERRSRGGGERRGALIIRPGCAGRVRGAHVQVVGGAGAQPDDREAGAAAAHAADLDPFAVLPFIDQVASRAGHIRPGQVDLVR